MVKSGRRLWRLAAPATAAFYVALATVVPVLHPFLHHRSPDGAPGGSPSLTLPTHEPGLGQRSDECPACLVSPGMTAPPEGAPVAYRRVVRTAIHHASERVTPPRWAGPANRERAPPLG